MPSTRKEWALYWASQGLSVFPCAPGAKVPAKGTAGFKDATRHPAIINAWWDAEPDYNIGCYPAASGHAILDIDPKHEGPSTLTGLEMEHGFLPETFTVATPSGGTHYWFRGDCPSTAGRVGLGLDTRGRGGYVLLPGSTVGGNDYTVAAGEIEHVHDLPQWISGALSAQRLAPAAAQSTALDLDRNVARFIALLERAEFVPAGQGLRNNDAYQKACFARDLGLSELAAFNCMVHHWRADQDDDHAEWLSERVSNAYQYSENAPGAKAERPTAEKFAGADLSTMCVQRVDKPSESRFRFLTEAQQDAQPDPTWLVDGLYQNSGVAAVYGPWGTMKTFWALDLAVSVASGARFLGHYQVHGGQRPVLFFAGEGSLALGKRRRPALKRAREIDQDIPFYLCENVPRVTSADDVRQMAEAITALGVRPGLVVFDTYARMLTGVNENDAGPAGEAVALLEAIAQQYRPCLVLAIAHAGKDEARGMRGSSAAPAGFDVLGRMKSDASAPLPKSVIYYNEKQKDADPHPPMHLVAEALHGSVVLRLASPDEAKAAEGGVGNYGRANVGAALRSIGAFLPQGCTTKTLAVELCRASGKDDDEAAIRSVERTLTRIAKKSDSGLAGYLKLELAGPVVPYVWGLPADDAD